MLKKSIKPILMALTLLFLYGAIVYQVYALRHPLPSNIVDIEVTHDGKTDKQLILLAEKEDKSREQLANVILLKGRNKDTIQFRKDPNNRVKLFLVTDKDSTLIFDNTKGGKDYE